MFILTNFKTYESSIGKNAINLAQNHQTISNKNNIKLNIAPSIIDIQILCKQFPNLPIRTQNLNSSDYGKFTGKIPAKFLKKLGVIGTMLNHSECRLTSKELDFSINEAKNANLKTVICAETVSECKDFLKYNSDYISYEPPNCIGNPNESITTTYIDKIHEILKIIPAPKLILGAGIKTAEDFQIAKKLGVAGLLISSAITQAKNPEQKLLELTNGL